MIRGNVPYVALAALLPGAAAALLATNVALWVAYRLWGNEATDV